MNEGITSSSPVKQDLALNNENGWYTIKPNQIKPIIASNHPKPYDVYWVFGFHQYEYESVLWLTLRHSEIFYLDASSMNAKQ